MLIYGAESIFAQFVLLKPLMDCAKEKGVIIIAILGCALECAGDIVAAVHHSKFLVNLSTMLSSVGSLSFAAISSIKSNNCSAEVRFL